MIHAPLLQTKSSRLYQGPVQKTLPCHLPPQTLQELAAGPIFSIETDNPTESAQPSIVIKPIATNRKRSDSKLLLLILLTLSLVTCALGAIVFLF